MSLPDEHVPGEATPGFGPAPAPSTPQPANPPGGPFAPPSAGDPAGPFAPPAGLPPFGQPLPGALPPGQFGPPAGFPPPGQPFPGAFPPPGYPTQPAGYPPPGGYGPSAPYGAQPPGYGQPFGPQPGGYGQPTSPYPPPAAPPGFGGYGPTPYASPAAVAPPPPVEGLATASLIVSLAGIVTGIGFVVGAILGFFGLRRVRRNGKSGRGLAMAAVIIGLIGTLATAGIVVLVVAFVHNPVVNAINHTPWTDSYSVGQCYAEPFAQAYASQADPVSCDRPHASEIIAKRNLYYEVFGYDQDKLQDAAYTYFAGQIETVVGDPATMSEALDWYFFLPSEDEWTKYGDGHALCWIDASGEELTGSFIDGTSNADDLGLFET